MTPVPMGGHRLSTIELNNQYLICGLTSAADPDGAGKLYCLGEGYRRGDDSAPHVSLLGNPPIAISTISKQANAVVTTAVDHNLVAGDNVLITEVSGTGPRSISDLNHIIYRVATTPTPTTFTFGADTIVGTKTFATDTRVYSAGGTGGSLLLIGPSTPRLGANNMTFAKYLGGSRAITASGQLYSWGPTSVAQFGSGSTMGVDYGTVYPPLSQSGVTEITASNPPVVTLGGSWGGSTTGLAANDLIYFNNGNPEWVANKFFRVNSIISLSKFDLKTQGGLPIDGTSWTHLTSFDRMIQGNFPTSAHSLSVADNVAFGAASYTPVPLAGSLDVSWYYNLLKVNEGYVASSPLTTTVMTSTGVYIWGNSSLDPLGDGSSAYRKTPVPVTPPSGKIFNKLYTFNNGQSSCALTTDNDVYCWGMNPYRVLGTTVGNKNVPTPQEPPSGSTEPLKFKTLGITEDDAITMCGLTP